MSHHDVEANVTSLCIQGGPPFAGSKGGDVYGGGSAREQGGAMRVHPALECCSGLNLLWLLPAIQELCRTNPKLAARVHVCSGRGGAPYVGELPLRRCQSAETVKP